MTEGQLEYAQGKARELFNKWNEATGFVPEYTGYYYEIIACIDEAVDIGARVECGQRIIIHDNGTYEGVEE